MKIRFKSNKILQTVKGSAIKKLPDYSIVSESENADPYFVLINHPTLGVLYCGKDTLDRALPFWLESERTYFVRNDINVIIEL